MTDDKAKRLEIIRKLIAKADDPACPEAERESLNAKAQELLIKYGIDEAIARAAATGEIRAEEITTRSFVLDVPKSYSYEYAVLGYRIAEVFNTRPMTYMAHGGTAATSKTGLRVVGFISDLDLIAELYASLARQCTFALNPWYRQYLRDWPFATASEKWNAKRGFITGFTNAVNERLIAIHKKAVEESGGTGTEIVLRDRRKQVEDWANQAFRINTARGRRYGTGKGDGWAAGQRADIGQGKVGDSIPSRRAIGG